MTALTTAAQPDAARFASFDVPLVVWVGFLALIVALLVLDLLVVHRTARAVSFREAAIESAVWIALGLGFTLVILGWQGSQAAGEYLTGYVIEKSLSVDNVFVWAVIFTYFAVPSKYQFRVLFWGIFGALVLRGLFIFAGVALLERFDWVLYVFGAVLLFSAYRIVRHDASEMDPSDNVALRLLRRLIPSTPEYDGQKLLTRRAGKLLATPLLAVLIMIESTDVVFAVDSIPAILAVSREEFIVYASNAFAILGLRALYFCLVGMADRFRYLTYGLGAILAFVGVKMLITDVYHVPTGLSLGVIAVTMTVAIVASLVADRRSGGEGPGRGPTPAERGDHQLAERRPG
jgi:tellurite resistance protein TerC